MILLPRGFVSIILHAHLPFIRHPEHEDFFEEKWLFEAICETYIPLLETFDNLVNEGVNFRITMSLTPSLMTMLADELLQERCIKHMNRLIELSEKEVERTKDQPEFNRLAKMYYEKYNNNYDIFVNKYNKNLITGFKHFSELGNLEIITCAATHGYLPLMSINPEAVRAQIAVGVQTYEKFLGKKPNGIWLPECGYVPQVEEALVENELKYFITESHGVLFATPMPIFGTFAPIVTPNGLVVFGRDMESSKQVWSASEGYPGDFDYREYYRDIGYDLDYDYIKPYIASDGTRIHTGIKYYRITGKDQEKQPYNPDWAGNKVDMHAANFMFNREKQVEYLANKMDRPPIIVCPYDAELFGHWWYEGPQWLYSLFKKSAFDQTAFEFITPSEFLDANPIMQVSTPCSSSWGYKGYNEVWLNTSNDWIYSHLHKASERMIELANRYPNASGIKKEALNQAARELLLAQSSDWAFIMRTGTVVQYAEKRTKDHIGRFTRLYYDIIEDNIDAEWLNIIKERDNIFPEIQYSVYTSREKR